MVSSFSQKITQLRKEKGLTQKSASESLLVSQALLSHYEKGIRECGLDFVVRAAKFYGASCDYLLGCSNSRISIRGDEDGAFGMDKGTLSSSLYVLLSQIEQVANPDLVSDVHWFVALAIYRAALAVNGTGAVSAEDFRLDPSTARALATTTMSLQESSIVTASRRLSESLHIKNHNLLSAMISESENHILSNLKDIALGGAEQAKA